MQIISFTISLNAVSDSPAARSLRQGADLQRSASTHSALNYPTLSPSRIRGAVIAQPL